VGIHSNPWLHPSHGFDAGFDVYVDITEGERQGTRPEPKDGETASRSSLDAAKGRVIETLKSAYYELPSSVRRVISQSYFTHHYLFDRANNKAEMAVDRAIETLDKQGTDDLFLWIHFMDVHRPYTLPPDSNTGIWQTARVTQPSYTNPSLKDQEHISRIYDESVVYVDNQIKRLYREFERRSLDEETLFVVTSDHGEEFGDHGDWFHRNFKLCNELLHVPLLVVDPDSSPDRIDSLVSLADVAPTLVEWIGSPTDFDGKLLPALWDTSKLERDVVISEIYDPDRDKVAIRTVERKYVRDAVQQSAILYDVQNREHPIAEFEFDDIPEDMQAHLEFYMDGRADEQQQSVSPDTEDRLEDLGYLE